ncbi:MAG: hypothetical protein ACI8SE_002160, partial [Bacteroidia bacterium]
MARILTLTFLITAISSCNFLNRNSETGTGFYNDYS